MTSRDVYIGKPPAETINVNVVIATPITNALNVVVEGLDDTRTELQDNRDVLEGILGEELKEE